MPHEGEGVQETLLVGNSKSTTPGVPLVAQMQPLEVDGARVAERILEESQLSKPVSGSVNIGATQKLLHIPKINNFGHRRVHAFTESEYIVSLHNMEEPEEEKLENPSALIGGTRHVLVTSGIIRPWCPGLGERNCFPTKNSSLNGPHLLPWSQERSSAA